MNANTVHSECACGRMSGPMRWDHVKREYVPPPGWFVASYFWDGFHRSIAACSADCIQAARVQTKATASARLKLHEAQIDRVKFEKVPNE